MKRIFLFIGVVFIALVTTAQEYIYIIEKDSHYLQEKVVVAVNDVDSISFVAPSECMENGYEWVDLGLSVKWATCNVGATKPEDYGNYYAWGETTPKDSFNWGNYKYCMATYDSENEKWTANGLTKYYSTIDNKTTLDPEDDAATVNMGGLWRMPTRDELNELKIKCTLAWINDYNGTGVAGIKATSKTNNNHIFLPASGYQSGKSLHMSEFAGYYLSSECNGYYVKDLEILSYSILICSDEKRRYCGLSVRAVCP